MSIKNTIMTALILGSASCGSTPVPDLPTQYQFSTDRSLADRGKLWRHSHPIDSEVTMDDTEPHGFQNVAIRYLHPGTHDKINRIYDEQIEITLLDGSRCEFEMKPSNHFVEECTGPHGNFTGMLRTLGRILDDEFVPVSPELGWETEDLAPKG